MKRWSACLVLSSCFACSENPVSDGPDVSTLIEQIENGDKSERKIAYFKLQELGPDATEAVPVMVEALKDEDHSIQNIATKTLTAIGKPAVPALAEALKDKDKWCRKNAALALSKMGADAAGAVTELIVAIRDEEVMVQFNAIQALEKLGPQARSAVPALIEALKDRSISSLLRNALVAIGEPAIPELSKATMDRNRNVRISAVRILGEIGTPAIPSLIGILNARIRFTDVAHEAINQLGEQGPAARAAVPQLIDRFDYNDEKTRRAASFAVAKIGSPAVPQLLEALKNPHVLTRQTACETVGRMKPLPEQALPILTELLKDPYPEVRADAGRAIEKYGPEAGKAIPALVEYLKESKHKHTARNSLSKIGSSAVPSFVEMLQHKDKRIRAEAAHGLGDIGPEARTAVPALLNRLQDDSPYVRNWVLSALYKIGPVRHKTYLPTLMRVLQKDDDKKVRAGAARTMGKVFASDKRATAAIIKAFDDPEQTVVRSALQSLRKMEIEPAVVIPAYRKLLKHEETGIRMIAADALGDLGPQAASAVPALIDAVNDKSDKYGHSRKSAAKALKMIDPLLEMSSIEK